MKLNVKKLLFGCVYLIAILALCIWRLPLSMQTNLNSLTEIRNTDWPINELTTKFSNVANIIIKSENWDTAKQTAVAITDILSTDEFNDLSVINTNVSVSDTINKLGKHRNSFLSSEYHNLLQTGEFATITNKAVSTVTSSLAPNVLPLKDDPFLLATNYLKELKTINTKWETRNGFLWQSAANNHYILISVNINTSNTANMVKNVNALSQVLNKYNTKKTKVFS